MCYTHRWHIKVTHTTWQFSACGDCRLIDTQVHKHRRFKGYRNYSAPQHITPFFKTCTMIFTFILWYCCTISLLISKTMHCGKWKQNLAKFDWFPFPSPNLDINSNSELHMRSPNHHSQGQCQGKGGGRELKQPWGPVGRGPSGSPGRSPLVRIRVQSFPWSWCHLYAKLQ